MAIGVARRLMVCAFVGFCFESYPCPAQAVLLESAVLGTTGRIGGTAITTVQYVGWRFEITEPLEVQRVGGHLLSYPDVPGELFGALVRLPAIDAFPSGLPFTEEEIVATTTFRANFPSDEILTPLAAELDPGSYALVFGTGQFGATGEGAIHNGPDQPNIPPTDISSFIFFSIPSIGLPPIWRTNLASNMRFVIEPKLLGDFDIDGDVDGRDFLTWQRGGSPDPLSGEDLADWQAFYGMKTLGGASTVPEPSSLMIVSLLIVIGRTKMEGGFRLRRTHGFGISLESRL